ncbi:prolyl oligopeptidase family serine peptidase [Gemmata sp. G18]|uniref:Prolyl oligopeptidase family serine peptidase n=1 Tax=Gemmata palustris TaxID=2822762 RepID=A0ABS5C4G8_9BACT|nr:DPP IV N-terminal domain-containing protein [Gemmata palustris]MBP3960850.1 prolyl oligopeptidase family serine peptidase [Gemmata palustris]
MTRCHAIVAIFVIALAPLVSAQERITGANYPLAQKFDRDFVTRHVQEASVAPQWIGKSDTFWYAARTATGNRYWRVDPTKKERAPLFDHVALASALSEASKKPLDGDTLRLDRVVVAADGKKFTFAFSENQYEFDLGAGKLKSTGKASASGTGPLNAEAIERLRGQLGDERVNEMLRRLREGETEQKKDDMGGGTGGMGGMGEAQPKTPTEPASSYKNYSPDKKKYVFLLKYNLYLCDEGQPEDKAAQLSTDGAEEYTFVGGFGGGGGGFGKGNNTGKGTGAGASAPADRKTRPNVTWSTDSKAFYITRADSRGVKDLYLVDSIADPRPKLEQYKYPMPGEELVRKTELYYCVVESKALTRITQKWKDERYSDLRWGKGPGELRFIRRDRLRRNLEICAFDVFSSTCKCLVNEAFDAAYLEMQTPRYIEETDEFVWWSERSGWGHFYRYGRDGTFKNALTSGAWRASRIVEIDAKAGFVYIIGNGREPGENLYYTHLYRVKLDGTGLTCLDPSEEPNSAPIVSLVEGSEKQPLSGFNQSSSLSPSKKFVVTNSTRVDYAPFATLRDDAGKVLMVLETTDLSALKKTGWQMPETFTVKAADGVTDLYGNMWKPFDFDAKKKYPIIAHVYPGPQTEGVVYRFSAHSQTMQLAQLGFIVIQVGHRGGSPERSKAYHSFGYFNLRDYGLVDKKAALEALAARHSFIDIDRVGIYGHSGGGFMSAAAVLQKPYNEFFKAAVASAGNHDNNIYNDNWSETYHGMKEVPVGDGKGTSTATDANTGAGKGFGKGTGGRKKGPTPEQALESELEDLLESFDPRNEDSVADLERKLADLNAKLAALKNSAAQAQQAPPPRTAGTALPVVTLPAMRFDIHIPTNAELAANLKGHLMLVHGEIDNNVHPANTMRLVDALIKANKRFDMLMIPGARHAFGAAQPYFTQRMWDFFAENLLNDRQTGADINIKDVKRK